MTKNPIINGLAALVYIIVISWIMSEGTKMVSHPNQFIAPVAVISLFTLSAAVMGYVFGFYPATMYLDGKKKQAVTLFLQTVFVFGILTAIMLILLFSRIIS